MSLDIRQQILLQFQNAKRVLICFKDIRYGNGYPAGGDAVASALALKTILQKNGKTADIVSPGFSLPASLSRLPGACDIQDKIKISERVKISINIKNSGIGDFSHAIDNEHFHIYLSPEEGSLDRRNVEITNGGWVYDLIVTLDTAEPALLGGLYESNKDFFDEVPIINIDDTPENLNYGDINLVDIKSSSVAEIIWRLLSGDPGLDENIIDCVLAGIIAKTKNFRKANISPRTLEVAGALIELGAKRNEIIDNFYRTKTVKTLRLWGRTLARLKSSGGVIWSVLARTDFIHSGAKEEELAGAMHELVANSPGAEIFAILFEGLNGKIKTILYSHKTNLELPKLGLRHRAGLLTHLPLPHPDLPSAESALIQELKKTI